MPGRFPTAWMDELYARADIVQIVSAYVPLKKNGSRYWGLCPFHHEKTPSFSVNGEQNLYYCFGCKAGGNVVQFVMEMEHLTYREAVESIAHQLHMPIPETQEDPDYERKRSQRERLLAANKEAAKWYHAQLWKPENARLLEYLHGRGVDDGTIRKFGLGAAPDQWDALTSYLEGEGYSQEELRLAGLTVVKEKSRFDMFRNRAIFPIIDAQGQVLGFGGRSMGNVQPKYLNTSDTPVFNKRKGVYAANLLKKQRNLKRIILVEGYMDVVALVQHGVNGVVATLGTSLTNEQARLLKRYVPEIWVSYDGDSAGQHAIVRALDIFEQEDISARVLFFPDNLDPDEFIRQRGLEAFQQLRPLRAAEYLLQRAKDELDLSDVEGRMEYAKRAASILRKVQEPVELDFYLQKLTVDTGFSRDVLIQQMGIQPPKTEQTVRSEHVKRPYQPRDERSAPEKRLLSILASGFAPEGAIHAEDFDTHSLRQAAEALLQGISASGLMDRCETDQERQELSALLAPEDGINAENAGDMVGQCLNAIRVQRKQKEIEARLNDLKTLPDTEKGKVLQEIQSIQQEIDRIKKSMH